MKDAEFKKRRAKATICRCPSDRSELLSAIQPVAQLVNQIVQAVVMGRPFNVLLAKASGLARVLLSETKYVVILAHQSLLARRSAVQMISMAGGDGQVPAAALLETHQQVDQDGLYQTLLAPCMPISSPCIMERSRPCNTEIRPPYSPCSSLLESVLSRRRKPH